MTRHQAGNSLIRALNVINTALAANCERGPWNQIVAAARSRLCNENLVISVKDDRAEPVHDERFLVQLRNDRFCMVGSRAADSAGETDDEKQAVTDKADWKVTTRYLDDLACRARYYVEHPSRIGLDWLTDRLGLAGPG